MMVGSEEGKMFDGSDAATERTRAIFEKMDTNKDGSLSRDEFVAGCLHDESLFKLLACNDHT